MNEWNQPATTSSNNLKMDYLICQETVIIFLHISATFDFPLGFRFSRCFGSHFSRFSFVLAVL